MVVTMKIWTSFDSIMHVLTRKYVFKIYYKITKKVLNKLFLATSSILWIRKKWPFGGCQHIITINSSSLTIDVIFVTMSLYPFGNYLKLWHLLGITKCSLHSSRFYSNYEPWMFPLYQMDSDIISRFKIINHKPVCYPSWKS